MPPWGEVVIEVMKVLGTFGGWLVAVLTLRALYHGKRDPHREHLVQQQVTAYRDLSKASGMLLYRVFRLERSMAADPGGDQAGENLERAKAAIEDLSAMAFEWHPVLPQPVVALLWECLGVLPATAQRVVQGAAGEALDADAETVAGYATAWENLQNAMRAELGTDALTADYRKLIESLSGPEPPS